MEAPARFFYAGLANSTPLIFLPRLLLITDGQRMPPQHFFRVAEASLHGGVDTILIREKQMDSARLLAFSSRMRALTRDAGARLIIHTRADIARAVEADGVHVETGGMGELPAIRNWAEGFPLSLSASCHNLTEIKWAHAMGADFALLSPVFPTGSHPGSSSLGEKNFKKLAKAALIPVIALGGIRPENRHLINNFGIAVISAILDATSPETAARNLLEKS